MCTDIECLQIKVCVASTLVHSQPITLTLTPCFSLFLSLSPKPSRICKRLIVSASVEIENEPKSL